MYDASDIVDLKNRKKRKRRLIRFIIFLLLIVAAAVIYLTQELWLPKLRGIGKQYKTIVNDGRLAEGNFPIEINGGEEYQLKYTDDNVIVLSDSYIYFYNQEGGLVKRRQHAYSNTVLRTAGGRALLFESGGNDFSVEDADSVIYSDSFDSANIMFARLSDEGYTAVVTTSVNYDCEIFVYDKKGTRIYERKCIERVNDIDFVDGSRGCVISYFYAENGSLSTSVQEINFRESGEKYSSKGLDTLGLDVYGFGDGAFILGVDACGYVDESGEITSFYRYDGDFAGGSSSEGKSAVIINNDDRRKYVAALFNGGGREPLVLEFDQPLTDIVVEDGLAYIMEQDKIQAYDFSGGLRSTAQINDSYTGFVRSDNYVFLKSYNKIDRIDYES